MALAWSKYCVEKDLAAAKALDAYPETAGAIMQPCIVAVGDYGWDVVKYCVDQDLEAARALEELEGSE
jgi:hypothetical protein